MARRLTPEQRVLRAMPEKDVQASVRNAAARFGWAYAHQPQTRQEVTRANGARFLVGAKDFRGFPDTVLARPHGALLFVECKREQTVVTPEQLLWLTVLGTLPGVRAVVVRPSTLPALYAILAARPGDRAPTGITPRT